MTGQFEEIIHGTIIKDPYRWLEDRNLFETEDWVRAQQHRLDSYFASFPHLGILERRVRDYLDVEVVDQPVSVRGRYFYRKRVAGREQGSICIRQKPDGKEHILVTTSEDNRFTAIGIHRLSQDAGILAYELRHGGSDRKQIRFLNVGTGTTLGNQLPFGYGRGLAFSRNGYFYCHEVGQSEDEHWICFESFDSPGERGIVFRAPRIKGSRLLLTGNAQRLGAIWFHPKGSDVLTDFWIANLADRTSDWVQVFRNRRAPYRPILCHDRILVVVETEMSGSQLIELSPRGEELRALVSAGRSRIRQVVVTHDRIFVGYLDQGIASLETWLLSGERADCVDLPQNGTIQICPVYAEDAESLFYTFESFDVPPAVYEYHPQTNATQLWHQQGPTNRTRCSHVQETTFPSKDGTQIPLTLVSLECDEAPDCHRPVIMTSYGGFGVTMTPQFSVFASIMMELGAIFALPHIRGGGEFGKAWHDAGRRRNRQTAFDDFVAAAQWLCDRQVTAPDQLAIFGGSNSGLLVATAMTQRPELFGAVLCIAPLLDMLRYESFDHADDWRSEYGTIEDPEDFQALYAYSPYHRVADDINYPATMFVTGGKDDRCNPAHVRKMAARLQNRMSQRSAVIVDYSEERGHAPVLPLSVRVEALARRIAFLSKELRIAVAVGGPDESPSC